MVWWDHFAGCRERILPPASLLRNLFSSIGLPYIPTRWATQCTSKSSSLVCPRILGHLTDIWHVTSCLHTYLLIGIGNIFIIIATSIKSAGVSQSVRHWKKFLAPVSFPGLVDRCRCLYFFQRLFCFSLGRFQRLQSPCTIKKSVKMRTNCGQAFLPATI